MAGAAISSRFVSLTQDVLEALVKKNVVVTAAAALLTAMSAVPAVAQSKPEGVLMNPAQARAALMQASTPQTPTPQTPAPQTPTPQAPAAQTSAAQTGPSVHYVTPGQRTDLGIEDAVARARERNIDIAVARVTPRLDDFAIASLAANYVPNATSSLTTAKTSAFPTQVIQGITAITSTQAQNWNAGIAQNIFWGGGSYTLNWTNSRTDSPASTNIRNPTFRSGITGAYTQPLWRGFKTDATRAALLTNKINQQNDEISLQATIETTDQNTRNAYWDLVYAVQAVDAAQQTLDISNELVSQNKQKVEIGTLAPIDVKSAESEAANNRLAIVQAQANVRTAELALKRLIVSGTEDPLWTASINPVDRPPTTAEPINVEAATARALRERTDMQQSLNNLKISDVNLRAQVDLVRPSLNLTASYGLNGLGGPYSTSVRDPITGQLITQPAVQSGWSDALSNLYGFDAPSFSFALAFAYPIGKSAQTANVARSKLALEQSQANIKSLQLQIATDVASAALTVQASTTARELAKDKLDAAQSKLDVGMATNYDVVQAQRDFASAQDDELRAIANYRKALVNFEAVQTVGTRTIGAGVGSGSSTGSTTGTSPTGSTTTTTSTTTTGTTTPTPTTSTTGTPGGGL
jgi:outer membrane protein TolC